MPKSVQEQNQLIDTFGQSLYVKPNNCAGMRWSLGTKEILRTYLVSWRLHSRWSSAARLHLKRMYWSALHLIQLLTRLWSGSSAVASSTGNNSIASHINLCIPPSLRADYFWDLPSVAKPEQSRDKARWVPCFTWVWAAIDAVIGFIIFIISRRICHFQRVPQLGFGYLAIPHRRSKPTQPGKNCEFAYLHIIGRLGKWVSIWFEYSLWFSRRSQCSKYKPTTP